jgi:hypothetical protein
MYIQIYRRKSQKIFPGGQQISLHDASFLATNASKPINQWGTMK